ncbi:hypothetical protein SLG_33100 [Sphingobium sp. SYK-6]|uniref:phage tail protein n=1 Tax=Sphingobium sp. (strain NBRC 103272 / SYK-6) TaxID=627192 RepID=UPI0002276FB8|nr:phage tail protein [Sphingobium sp. SYK-6]BAK67985.1 hypothetical protein SLG_33100 [Sphingobium sp. SYK-6]
MATLVLTALGSAIGGPLGAIGAAMGGAIGAVAGQAIDGLIFRPGPQSGPRLSDLQVQTSRYGARIPRIYGTMRVAGTVIWSTDLIESSSTSGGGKGQPSITRYSYSASFAVALSSRPIAGIGRIWADGNLLRGAAGDWKSPVSAFRIHHGGQDQPVDPLIAADVGIAAAPACRGCAYVLFEGLDLADFGNRIPSLTIELFADAAPPGIASIVSDLAGEPVVHAGDEDEPHLAGFAAEGSDVRETVAPLTDVFGMRWREREGAVALGRGAWTDRTLARAHAIRSLDGRAVEEGTKRREAIETLPARLTIRHHDPDRDFQIGSQSAERPGPGPREENLDLPAVLTATQARTLAGQRLRAAGRERSHCTRAMDWTALDLAPGDIVALEGEAGRWLIEASDWEDMAVRLTLRAVRAGARPDASAGDPGGMVREPDLAQGPTSLAIVEWPPDGATLATAPQVCVAATGADAGWRRAALFRTLTDPPGDEPIGRTAPRAVIGTALTALPAGVPWRIDRHSHIEVELDNAADALTSIDDDALISGGNPCQIGQELLLFGEAEPLAPRRYRLSRLIRGWRGTEWAAVNHEAGERFLLLDPARLAAVALTSADAGRLLTLKAIGSGDLTPAVSHRAIEGSAMLPLSPVHGRVRPAGGGDLAIGWIRRSRLGWLWSDHADSPLGEETEAYLVRVTAGGIVLREWETATTATLYGAAQRSADLLAADGHPLRMEIRQRGMWGLSRPLVLDIA